jgi:hypothetical protein
MNKHSKLLLSQTAVALPVAFSATTYQINETLSVERNPTSLEDSTDEVSSLYFDISTGNYALSSTTEDPNSDSNLAISLYRSTETNGDAYTGLKSKGNPGKQTNTLKAKSSTPYADNPLDPLGTNSLPIAPNFKATVSGITTTGTISPSGYMGVKAGYLAFAGVGSTSTESQSAYELGFDLINYPYVSGTSNTKYLGYLAGEDVQVYATLSFEYVGNDYFTDSITVNSITVGDPGEQIITYEEFVAAVPENKQTAALVGLLAGSAALYNRRRKKV